MKNCIYSKCDIRVIVSKILVDVRSCGNLELYCKSLFRIEIGPFNIGSKIDLIYRLQNHIEKSDSPPDHGPDNEEIALEEPAEEVHVSNLDLEDLG